MLLITTIALTAPASAQITEHFQLLDENGDQVLTGNELRLVPLLKEQHAGRVDLSAFTASIRSREVAHHAQWLIILEQRDGNKDGRLSGNEFSGFEFADLDKNGRIDQREYNQGVREFYTSLIPLGPQGVAAKAIERFKSMDINADGRLSGTEAAFMDASDMTGDKRIALQEYITAAVLDMIAAGEDSPDNQPAPPPAPVTPVMPPAPVVDVDGNDSQNDALSELVATINAQDSKAFLALCRPEFQKLVNPLVLDYLLKQIKTGNGKLSMPQSIQVTDDSQPGAKTLAAEIPTQRGTLEISTVVLEGKILGIAMNGSAVDGAIQKLMLEMMSDVDGKLTEFAKDCSPHCMRMIRRIQAGEDDVAIEMFHPEIQQRVGKETFVALFEELRKKVGQYQQIELEAAGVDMNADGTGGFISVTHRVQGTQGIAMVKHKLQIVGFKPYMVIISLEPTES